LSRRFDSLWRNFFLKRHFSTEGGEANADLIEQHSQAFDRMHSQNVWKFVQGFQVGFMAHVGCVFIVQSHALVVFSLFNRTRWLCLFFIVPGRFNHARFCQ
jgi:hypothetical protein